MPTPADLSRCFFDVHMHAMDLSHPNLIAFARRINGLGMKMIFGGLAEPFLSEKEKKVLNLLTVMENSIEDYFCIMEYFLRTKEPLVGPHDTFRTANREFDTIIMTPLIMDFGLKHIDSDTFYDVAVGKPVAEQSADVLRAIAKYASCEMRSIDGDRKNIEVVSRQSRRLFEIYPFLGITTANYSLAGLQGLLDRFFGEYTGTHRALFENMGSFSEGGRETGYFRDALRGTKSDVFAGVKLYPPLGFDPWPSGNEAEMEKVRALYTICQERGIPITAHCSDGGFQVVDHAEELTNPDRWVRVLGEFPELKLNLAHFGNQETFFGMIHRHEWREKILYLIRTYPNVYTDISCLAFNKDFYGDLAEVLRDAPDAERPKLASRILFGSDYMINLQWIASYNEYLEIFLATNELASPLGLSFDPKVAICCTNPAKFLFRPETGD